MYIYIYVHIHTYILYIYIYMIFNSVESKIWLIHSWSMKKRKLTKNIGNKNPRLNNALHNFSFPWTNYIIIYMYVLHSLMCIYVYIYTFYLYVCRHGFPFIVWVAQMVKKLPAVQEIWVLSLGQEAALEKRMATHSNILAWRIPGTEEPGGLQSMGLQRVGHDWMTDTFTFFL